MNNKIILEGNENRCDLKMILVDAGEFQMGDQKVQYEQPVPVRKVNSFLCHHFP